MENKQRLIDANVFESEIRKMFRPYGDGTYPGDYEAMIHDETLVDVLETINEASIVDAVEVVHGRWVLEKVGSVKSGYECSVCRKTRWFYSDVPQAFNYCPNCGAKMDLEEK